MKAVRLKLSLPVHSLERAVDFYKRAFSSCVTGLYTVEKRWRNLTILGKTVHLKERRSAKEKPDDTSIVIDLQPGEIEKIFCQMVAAGAQVSRFITTVTGHDTRDGRLIDPFGHTWILREQAVELKEPATVCKDLSFEINPVTNSHSILPGMSAGTSTIAV